MTDPPAGRFWIRILNIERVHCYLSVQDVAERMDSVSVVVARVVQLDAAAERVPPQALAHALSAVSELFDGLVREHGAFRVESCGAHPAFRRPAGLAFGPARERGSPPSLRDDNFPCSHPVRAGQLLFCVCGHDKAVASHAAKMVQLAVELVEVRHRDVISLEISTDMLPRFAHRICASRSPLQDARELLHVLRSAALTRTGSHESRTHSHSS